MGASTEQIVEKVWLSIAERRLRPGVQLKEEQLAAIFSVSRARIRQALAVLERDGLVTIIPNRGAFVCKPSVEEARDVFFVRRTVERCVVHRLCTSISKADIKRLRDHVAKERIANANDSTTDIIKLSGGFHLLLAEIAGSDFLFTTMRDLIARSSLITAVYRNTNSFNCGPDEHAEIVEAIAKNNPDKATDLMTHHLEHVESELDLSEVRDLSHDLRAALA
jgi:DNA-binding GntR family transcriptional regulator